MSTTLKSTILAGQGLQWQGRQWRIIKIRRGRVYLRTDGLPEQSANWLFVEQAIGSGRAVLLPPTQ